MTVPAQVADSSTWTTDKATTQASDFIKLIPNTADLVHRKAVYFFSRVCDTLHHTACYIPKRNLFMHYQNDSLQNGSHVRLNHSFITSETLSACMQHIQTSGTRNTCARMHTNKKQILQPCQASTLALGPSCLLFNGYLASIPGIKQLKHWPLNSTELGTNAAIHLLPYIPPWHGLMDCKSFYISIRLFCLLDTCCRLRFKYLSWARDTHKVCWHLA